MLVFLFHITLAIALFFLLNWIGRHSLTLGYVELSAFEENDDAPAFNFAIRFAGPLVFMVLVSTVMFATGNDEFTRDLYLVPAYYFIFRFGFNLLWGRASLMNWTRELTIACACIVSGYLLYVNLISVKQRLIPDVNNIANQLWLIIVVFVYSVLNRVEISSVGADRRRNAYRKAVLVKYESQFGGIVSGITKDEHLRRLIFAIMIYEDFNRPKPVRALERLFFRLGKSRTLGIMQVSTESLITDEESVRIGGARILEAYERAYFAGLNQKDDGNMETITYAARYQAIVSYNRDETYVSEVLNIFNALEDEQGGNEASDSTSQTTSEVHKFSQQELNHLKRNYVIELSI